MSIEKVVDLLAEHGWIPDGRTDPIARVVQMPIPDGAACANYASSRDRYRRGDSFCTVGKRTVNFYQRGRGGFPENMQQAKTKDVARVEELAKHYMVEQESTG